MIVHTNIEKYTILDAIMDGLQICTINKRLVKMAFNIYVLLNTLKLVCLCCCLNVHAS